MNKLFRIILGLAVLGFFIWILNFHLIFLGQLKVVNNFTSNSSFISELQGTIAPVKDLASKESYQEIRLDQASSDIYVPPYTEKIEIEIKATNPDKKILYSYIDAEGDIKNFTLQEEEFKELNWELKEIGEYLVLYNPDSTEPYNIDGLLENKMDGTRAYYASEVLNSLILKRAGEQDYYTNIDLPLRGDHSLNVYVTEDGILDININFQQRIVEDSKIKEKLGFAAYLTNQEEEILFNKNSLKDNDSIKIYQENLEPGIYKLELSHDNDITLENIKTHNFFSIKDEVVLNDPSKSTGLKTNSSNLYFSTAHNAGVQELGLDGEKVSIKLKETTKFKNKQNKIININTQNSDFNIKGSGNTRFISGAFNDELVGLVLNNSQLDLKELSKKDNEIEYIIFRGTDYFNNQLDISPQTNDFNYSFELDPNLINIDEDGVFNLNLIIPDHENKDSQVKIFKIKVTYYRSFWKYLRNYFQ